MTGALGGMPSSSIQSDPSNQTLSTNLTIADDMNTLTHVDEQTGEQVTSTPREPSAFELEHRLNSLTEYVYPTCHSAFIIKRSISLQFHGSLLIYRHGKLVGDVFMLPHIC